MKLGGVVSKYDKAMFTWYIGNKLQDIIAAHINDFCFVRAEIFQRRVVDRLCHVSAVKSEEVAEFEDIGLDIKKNRESIKLRQNEYIKKLKYIPVAAGRNLKDTISTKEITEIRQVKGQLN